MRSFSFLLFLAIAALLPLRGFHELPITINDPLFDPATAKKLDALIVDVNWEKADIETVAKELSVKSKLADPDHRGIKFALQLQLPKDLTKADERGLKIGREISISLTQAPITAVLDHLCSQTNLCYEIHRNVINFIQWHPDKDHIVEPLKI